MFCLMTLHQDLKLKFYDLMIQFALHQTAYLDVAKHYYKIWETPSIKVDEAGKGRQVCDRYFKNLRCVLISLDMKGP